MAHNWIFFNRRFCIDDGQFLILFPLKVNSFNFDNLSNSSGNYKILLSSNLNETKLLNLNTEGFRDYNRLNAKLREVNFERFSNASGIWVNLFRIKLSYSSDSKVLIDEGIYSIWFFSIDKTFKLTNFSIELGIFFILFCAKFKLFNWCSSPIYSGIYSILHTSKFML